MKDIQKKWDIGIVGAGASGLCAAIEALRRNPQLSVILFEKGSRPGRKILASGNGRCNISNKNLDISHYHGENADFTSFAINEYSLESTANFFLSTGIPMREDGSCGRLYPYSFTASAVIDGLRHEAAHLGAEISPDSAVLAVKKSEDGFVLRISHNNDMVNFQAKSVIIACGGAASPSLGGSMDGYGLLQGLGHEITPLLPSIVQLNSESSFPRAMEGLRIEAAASYNGNRQSGEVLFTKYGLSGPAVMQLSGECVKALSQGNKPVISINLLPDMTVSDITKELFRRKNDRPWINLEHFLTGLLHKRIGVTLLKAADVAPLSRDAASLSSEEIKKIAKMINGWDFIINGNQGMTTAQVTAGGAKTNQFCPKTMESRITKGLFACGEVLDIDGDCGGYNLQWAWSSGRLAGRSAAANTNIY